MAREIGHKRLMADINRVLKNPIWIDGLQTLKPYERLHDDDDGQKVGRLMVQFSQDGDAWIRIDGEQCGPPLRFRAPMIGGGQSPMVFAALRILAHAIRKDNQSHPQK